ncbi:hypothetical protein OUZ56_012241 [Daphnia magna]|uniref:Uncharacterized protein n=1 Tax=Daphnia magna TaxID=35525 RepID=A0ABQ9Z2F0_9CRUS|nr:hypothetical protein OUZ56_012241 [Daphnia magna]
MAVQTLRCSSTYKYLGPSISCFSKSLKLYAIPLFHSHKLKNQAEGRKPRAEAGARSRKPGAEAEGEAEVAKQGEKPRGEARGPKRLNSAWRETSIAIQHLVLALGGVNNSESLLSLTERVDIQVNSFQSLELSLFYPIAIFQMQRFRVELIVVAVFLF